MILVATKKTVTVTDNAATGRNARKVRERNGESLRSCARKIGVTPSYLSDLETGHRSWNGPKAKAYIALLEMWEGEK